MPQPAPQRYLVEVSTRHGHYERAFESYLHARGIDHLSMRKAKSLLPDRASLRIGTDAKTLKAFDVAIYPKRGGATLLLDVKGRKTAASKAKTTSRIQPAPARLESWVTENDVLALQRWESLFQEAGIHAHAGFVFVYWRPEPPAKGLFQEVFEHDGRWYAIRAVRADAYLQAMQPRSRRWRTVHVPSKTFDSISGPLVGGWRGNLRPAKSL